MSPAELAIFWVLFAVALGFFVREVYSLYRLLWVVN